MILISNLEFIVQSKKDAVQAERHGATRLELVSAISEGGLTPSYGTLKETINSVSIPVNIVIRPHSHDYFYDEGDMKVILEDVKQVLYLGGNRIVFGALNKDRTINEDALKRIISLNPSIKITFHGAIDHAKSIIDSYKLLIEYKQNVQCLVTAGGEKDVEAGAGTLAEMVRLQKEHNGPVVMPGTGLRLSNIGKVHQMVRADLYHFGQGVRKDEKYAHEFDAYTIKNIISILEK